MSTPLQPSDEQAKVITGCLLLLSIIALAGVFYVTQAVLVPFVIAIFIATIVTPLVDLLVLKWKMPQIIAISLTLLLVLSFGFLICMTLIYSTQQVIYKAENQYSEKFGIFINSVFEAAKEADDLPVRKLEEDTKEPQPETPDQKEAPPEAPPTVIVDDGEAVAAEKPEIGWFQKMGIDLDTLKKATMDYMRNSLKSIAVSTMQSALNFTTTSFFVAIFVIFLLAGRDPNAVVKNEIYFEIEQKIRSYISTKLVLSLITGTLVGVTLKLFGLELALVFAILTFLLNFIPSVGSVIATLLPIPVAFAQFSDSPWTIAGVILIPGGIQMAIGNGIEPKLMGEGLQLHPVTVLLALSFWTLLWGPIGAILAVPITAAIRIVLMRFESGRTAGNLLAGILPGGSTTVA
ncbi:AI-2E family transporter [Gimesia maris]|uniref:AI-2 transport protein TqsA n=2 Tax=Gimesia maris TaxID=122 RepID=A0ABX5YWG2_9PLAN|nr:AI-2E family transporter [Gimesia maris]EDL60614.1 putative membrane protein-putative a permease [Gimesia maris DSM 8797]QEG19876.1 AI-2 transport protein TqsA [Gimesia maris]QGQ27315.1 AI-2E family transporter [Gimesia maris]